MATKSLRRSVLMLVALVLLGEGARAAWASGSSQFQVTDLGAKYTLQGDSTGAVQSVTSAGGQVFGFDKSPVTQIDQVIGPDFYYYTTTYLFQNGTHKVGYLNGTVSVSGTNINVPTGAYFLGDWATSGDSPVSDMNSKGEFVGKGYAYSTNVESATSFAEFSTPTGQFHGGGLIVPGATLADRYYPDDLNNYINAQGVYLTAALKVDDLGQIIAQGTLNGQNEYFLLTPTATPEPTTLFVLASGIGVLGLRSASRRRNRRSASIARGAESSQ